MESDHPVLGLIGSWDINVVMHPLAHRGRACRVAIFHSGPQS
jgi:hypothetical protein